jgi:hypothetical protein
MAADQPRRGGDPLSESRSGSSVYDDVTGWFFDDYLPHWVGVGSGTIAQGPQFILDYWGRCTTARRTGASGCSMRPAWWACWSAITIDCGRRATRTPLSPTGA